MLIKLGREGSENNGISSDGKGLFNDFADINFGGLGGSLGSTWLGSLGLFLTGFLLILRLFGECRVIGESILIHLKDFLLLFHLFKESLL